MYTSSMYVHNASRNVARIFKTSTEDESTIFEKICCAANIPKGEIYFLETSPIELEVKLLTPK